jgi:hypothetical protein
MKSDLYFMQHSVYQCFNLFAITDNETYSSLIKK